MFPSVPTEPCQGRARTRENPHGLSGQGWRDRLVSRCLARGTADREALRADARRRRIAVLRELRDARNSAQDSAPIGASEKSRLVDAKAGWGDTSVDDRTANDANDPSLFLRDDEIDALVSELQAALEQEQREEDEALLSMAANELYVTFEADGDNEVADLGAFSQDSCGSTAGTQTEKSLPSFVGGLNETSPFRCGSGLKEKKVDSCVNPSGENVLCPVCMSRYLFILSGCVSCACGLSVAGGAGDSLTLDLVRQRLDAVFSEHADTGCLGKLIFTAQDSYGIGFTFLHVKCLCCPLSTIAF